MPSSRRRTQLPVIQRLKQSPQHFRFLQAIRLIERATVLNTKSNPSGKTHPVSRYSPPGKEIIRFFNSNQLAFSAAEIESITSTIGDNGEHWDVVVNFIGLTGASGVLPYHYSELLAQRSKARDNALDQFFDLFNHRTTSLFFQASAKYCLPLEYERSKLHGASKTKECKHTHALLSLLGLGTHGLRNRQAIPDETLIFYSGLLTSQVKTQSGLEQIISDYFGVKASVEGFIGQWQELIDDVRTRLGRQGERKGQNACLGRSSMLGNKGWFAQGKSKITIGPLSRSEYEKFSPNSGALKSMNGIVAAYLGFEQDYEFNIQIKRESVSDRVSLNKHNPPTLAWNTWLSGNNKHAKTDEDILNISVSSKKLH